MAKTGFKRKADIFTAAYKSYMDIEDERDLKKNKLTLAGHFEVFDHLKKLSGLNGETTTTICAGVADWFRRKNFTVKEHGIGFIISLD